MDLGDLPQITLTILFVGVVIVSGFLALTGLVSDDNSCVTGFVWNDTGEYCHAAANVSSYGGLSLIHI